MWWMFSGAAAWIEPDERPGKAGGADEGEAHDGESHDGNKHEGEGHDD